MALEIKSFEASLNSLKKKKKKRHPRARVKISEKQGKGKDVEVDAGRKEIPITKMNHDF